MQMADGEESPFQVGRILARDLAPNTTEDDLKRHFTRYGDITEAIIPFDSVTGNRHSFGFVTFVDPSVITVVLGTPHPINNFWAEVSRAMKGEDLQTLESQRIRPRPTNYSHIFEGPGHSDKRSISVSESRPSGSITKHKVNEYFLGYGNVFSCSFICGKGCGLVVFSNKRTIDRVLRKLIHNLDGSRLDVWRYSKPNPQSIRHIHNSNLPPRYRDNYVYGKNLSHTPGGVDWTIIAPTNHRVILGSQANVAVVGDDQRLRGEEVEARRGNISAPNMTLLPQTRQHPIDFGGHWPKEGGFGGHNVIRLYASAPYNTTDPYTNYRANHEMIRPDESAPNMKNPNTNRGINLRHWPDNGILCNRMVTRPADESAAPSMMAPHMHRIIDLGTRLNNAVFGDHRIIQPHEPASNTMISPHTNRGVSLGYSSREGTVFANNQLEGKEFEVEQRYAFFPVLGRDDAGVSPSSNDSSYNIWS